MSSVTRALLLVAFLGLPMLGGPHRPALAADAQFALAVGQSVTVGQYTLVFRGVIQRQPTYGLYVGSVLTARFPSSTPSPNPADRYASGTVGVVTRTVAPDGSAVTGTLTVQ